MRIIFVMRHSGSMRFYEQVLRSLAKEGHAVRIAASKYHELYDETRVNKFCAQTGVEYRNYPAAHDRWDEVLKLTRKIQDYLRYLSPEYKHADKLRERAAGKMPFLLMRFLNLACKYKKNIWLIIGLLRMVDRAIPGPKRIKQELKDFRPDVFLITPLVDFGVSQLDWLKCAKELGIKTCLCVGSWDNLTNKGLVQIEPESAIVWNRFQADELRNLHRLLKTKIFITGAQCFDPWFEISAEFSRQDFMLKVGLNPKRPFILYLCSAPFICPDEVDFIRKWITAIRESADHFISGMGVLIRPHPQNSAQWQGVDFSAFDNVCIYPRAGALPIDTGSRNDFFCSMFYSEAVAGVNTSAMIEAGILRKPVFTICNDEFRGTQEGTLHFRYLTEGGLLYSAADFSEHIKQIKEALQKKNSTADKLGNFINEFVRPHGLNVPAAPLVKNAILQTAGLPKTPYGHNRLLSFLLRIMLLPFALLVFCALRSDVLNKKNPTKKSKKSTKKTIDKMANKMISENLILKVRRKVLRKFTMIFARLKFIENPKKTVEMPYIDLQSRKYIEETKNVLQVIKQVKGITKSKLPIIAGPWLSEVGFEVLYWIPFLNWFQKEYAIPREDFYIVSRGGPQLWYKNITDNYADLFDYITPEALQKHQQERISAGRELTQKHTYESDFDKKIVSAAAGTFGLKEYEIVHPQLMYQLFRGFWRRKQPVRTVTEHCLYQPFKPVNDGKVVPNLPQKYIAAKFYFNSSFPMTKANIAVINRLLERITRKHHVVIMESGINIDDHSDCLISNSDRIHRVPAAPNPRDNLDIQTRILSGAEMFIGTYGGFSYLSAFYGRPALAIYSQEWLFLPVHLDVINRAIRFLKYGECDRLIKADDLPQKSNAEFLVLDTTKIGVLDVLLGGLNEAE